MERQGVTVKEAAKALACCEKTVRNEMDNGTLPFYTVGKRGKRIYLKALKKRLKEVSL